MSGQVKVHSRQSHIQSQHKRLFKRPRWRATASFGQDGGPPEVDRALREAWARLGYSLTFRVFNRILNVALAGLFLLLALPVFIVIPVLIRRNDHGPAFYVANRLGRHKKPFKMYKFRSLAPGSDKKIGAEVLTPAHDVMTPFGKFIRDTKIDELPQLLNVLKGDMDLVGPRPQRPEICMKYGETIADYDLRFAVKPGLIGFPQLFLPHTAPKRIQSYFDNRYIRRRAKILQDLGLVLLTIVLVFKQLSLKLFKKVCKNVGGGTLSAQGIAEKRCLKKNRVDVKDATLEVFSGTGETPKDFFTEGELLDIDEGAFRVRLDAPIPAEGVYTFRITVKVGLKTKVKIVRVRCQGEVYTERRRVDPSEAHLRYWVMNYRPLTTVDYFKIEKYFLKKSMAD